MLTLPESVKSSSELINAPPETRTSLRRIRACDECDLVVVLPRLKAGESAECPRCHHTLVRRHYRPVQRSIALAISALSALLVAMMFPFVSFNLKGFENQIEVMQTASALLMFDQPLVSILVALTIVVLPALYLFSVIWLQLGLLNGRPTAFSRSIARALHHMHPWMMADVFIIGALVSLIKISGMAEIHFGVGFWGFCSFAILLLMTMRSIDADWMWFSIAGEPSAPEGTMTGQTAVSQGLTGCPTCGLLNRLGPDNKAHCQRCAEVVHQRVPHSMQRTWALLAAAIMMYIPANIYPIMQTTSIAKSHSSTIIGGVIELINAGSWPVGLIIFIASIVVPIGKILALGWLCYQIQKGNNVNLATRIRLYRITEIIGRWSMVDVFVVAILVALIRAGNLMSVTPGPAALAFSSVVILTMLAAISFDPRLIWDNPAGSSDSSGKDS